MTSSVSVLGSTGSIGTQTLQIIRERPDDYVVTALSVGRSTDVIAQAEEFRPQVVAVADVEAAAEIGPQLPEGVDLRDRFKPKFASATLVPVKNKTISEALNPQPRCLEVLKDSLSCSGPGKLHE